MYGARITGIGIDLPSEQEGTGQIMTNDDIAKILKNNRDALLAKNVVLTDDQLKAFETSDEWISERTGIKTRHIANPDQATSDLATRAGQRALQHSGLNPDKVDLIILATVSHDFLYSPPTGTLIQKKIGLKPGTPIIDTTEACSSFIHALQIAYAQIRSGLYRKILVIGADVMSRTVNWNDRGFTPILGDAAGALVLEAVPLAEDNFVENAFLLGADGSMADLIIAPAGGSKQPLTAELLANPLNQPHKLWMNGREVLKQMSRLVPRIVEQALAQTQVKISDIDFWALHQANLRIIESITPRLRQIGLRDNAIIYNNIQRVGNTTSASIALIWHEAWQKGILTSGMLTMAVVFGGGITWGTVILRWPTLPETLESTSLD